MTAEELMAFKAMQGGSDMSSYEHAMLAEKTSRHPSNAALWGVGFGVFASAAAIGAWIYSGTSINQANKYNMRAIDQLATFNLAERNERIGYQTAANRTTIDIISGAQANAGANSVSSAYAQAEAQILANALTGQSQMCPKPITLYSAPQPCPCPTSCGC